MAREIDQLIRELGQNGWTAERTRGQHYKLTRSSGLIYFCSGTASDRRAIKNIRADIARLLTRGYVKGSSR